MSVSYALVSSSGKKGARWARLRKPLESPMAWVVTKTNWENWEGSLLLLLTPFPVSVIQLGAIGPGLGRESDI